LLSAAVAAGETGDATTGGGGAGVFGLIPAARGRLLLRQAAGGRAWSS
jgi:hypothetical protein